MTKLNFQPQSVLCDKGVIRRVYERRVRLALDLPPTLSQVEAANVYARLCNLTSGLYITEQTAHILHRRLQLFAASMLADTQILQKGRYQCTPLSVLRCREEVWESGSYTITCLIVSSSVLELGCSERLWSCAGVLRHPTALFPMLQFAAWLLSGPAVPGSG